MKSIQDNFQIIETLWDSQDFRLINFQDSSEKGVCYSYKTWVTMHQHKSIDDIIISSIEESIHQSIRDNASGTMSDESENIDLEQEEELVKRLFWIMNDWVDFRE